MGLFDLSWLLGTGSIGASHFYFYCKWWDRSPGLSISFERRPKELRFEPRLMRSRSGSGGRRGFIGIWPTLPEQMKSAVDSDGSGSLEAAYSSFLCVVSPMIC